MRPEDREPTAGRPPTQENVVRERATNTEHESPGPCSHIMRSIHVSRQMTAPPERVWAVLADFPNISDWNTGVKASHATTDATDGVGARRHCDLAPLGAIEETIAEWEEGSRLVITIDSAEKLPIDHGIATFSIEGDTTTVDYDFEPAGIVGRMMGPMLSRQLTKGFTGFLDDLDTAAGQATAAG